MNSTYAYPLAFMEHIGRGRHQTTTYTHDSKQDQRHEREAREAVRTNRWNNLNLECGTTEGISNGLPRASLAGP